MTVAERLTEMHRHMKAVGTMPRRRKATTAAPVVRACDRCCDWHSGSCKAFQAKKAARR
jgi:hypothetical protein